MAWLLLSGCSSPQPRDADPTPSAPTSTTTGSLSPSIDPRAQPAIDAYMAFNTASNSASLDPQPLGSAYPPKADFTRYSFDPIRAQTSAYLAGLAEQKVRFKGTPPVPRVRIRSIDLDAKPHPSVVLNDCQSSSSDWDEYDLDGTRVPLASASAPPPYLITATVIYFNGHWGLQSTTADTSRTCTG